MKILTEQIRTLSGNLAANQFVIRGDNKIVFKSYSSIIAVIDHLTYKTTLDINKWDYSRTTSKYRNIFLGESKKETIAKIKNGIYKLRNLN